MTDTAVRLQQELSSLPPDDRAALARFLIESLDSTLDPDAEALWDAELTRRENEIVAGTALGDPADKVLKDIREKLA